MTHLQAKEEQQKNTPLLMALRGTNPANALIPTSRIEKQYIYVKAIRFWILCYSNLSKVIHTGYLDRKMDNWINILMSGYMDQHVD